MSNMKEATQTAAVLVGADGSAPSLMAVELAAREAALRQRPLRIVHALARPVAPVPLQPVPVGLPADESCLEAERIVAEAVVRARATAPELTISGEVVTGPVVSVLLDRARAAELAVVGDRGLGGFAGLLLGSVTIELAMHAACLVLVARGSAHPGRPVLLGVDGSPAGDAAIGFAFEAAALRGAPLVALHAWSHPTSSGRGDMLPLALSLAELEANEDRVLAEALAGWQEKYPEVTVFRRLVRGGTRRVLIEASAAAQLVVVGARGRGGVTGLLLGSASHALLHHAACPVALVRNARHAG